MVNVVKETFNIDDSLDVFAVHGIGGLLGILLIPFLTAESYGGIGYDEGSSFSDLMIHKLLVRLVLAYLLWLAQLFYYLLQDLYLD